MASGDEESLSLSKEVGNLTLKDQPICVPEGTILVNYDDHIYCELPRQTRVESILANTHVVLFGEGNLTFTFALAVIQGGWSRILSTRFEPATENEPLPDFNSIQQECVKNCVENGKKLGITPDNIIENMKLIMSVTAPMFTLCGIDATSKSFIEGKVAWFQCPWISLCDGTDTTARLITKFLKRMARQQVSSDYVLIGITKRFAYVKSYKLVDLLDLSLDLRGSRWKMASSKCSCSYYDFIGADDSFIKKILQFGYRHQALSDIHEKIIQHHITLIFQRNKK